MRYRFVFIIFSLIVGSWTTTVVADNHFSQGKVFENFIHIKETDTQIALPPGKWEVASTTEESNNVNTYILKVILFQETEGIISRVVYFSTPIERTFNGYQEIKYCSRDSLHYRKTISSSNGGNQECRWVNHQRLTWIGNKRKLKNAAGEYIRKRNLTAPNHMITSGYRFADSYRFLDVWYLINPQIDGFPDYTRSTWQDSPWHPQNVAADLKKTAYIERLKAWTDEWHQRVKAGFDEKLTGAPKIITAKPIVDAPPESETPSLAARLKRLDELFKQELLSKQEYEKQRRRILDAL
jgi:hypothetical protein